MIGSANDVPLFLGPGRRPTYCTDTSTSDLLTTTYWRKGCCGIVFSALSIRIIVDCFNLWAYHHPMTIMFPARSHVRTFYIIASGFTAALLCICAAWKGELTPFVWLLPATTTVGLISYYWPRLERQILGRRTIGWGYRIIIGIFLGQVFTVALAGSLIASIFVAAVMGGLFSACMEFSQNDHAPRYERLLLWAKCSVVCLCVSGTVMPVLTQIGHRICA